MAESARHLAAVDATLWQGLADAVTDRTSPLRTPVLATTGANGADARTVVLRGVDIRHRQLVCYSDGRAGKCDDLARDDRATWVFHDPAGGRQWRVHTAVVVHRGEGLAQAHWARLPVRARAEYAAAAAPGTVLDGTSSDDDSAAAAHFAVLIARATRLDHLVLDRGGHRRMRFDYGADGRLEVGHGVQP